MRSARAHAKINLALVVGPTRADGKHEVVTVLQRVELCDVLSLESADGLTVSGFESDTIVAGALRSFARAAGCDPAWHVRVEKHIPVAAGLGGGSSDAASALALANATLPSPLGPDVLHEVAAGVGADVPFFLRDRPQLGTGDGTELRPLATPTGMSVVLVLPRGEEKASTAVVYARFDERGGAAGFEGRCDALLERLEGGLGVGDLAALPRNDLASSPVAARLEDLGALRADVSGAGPAVYGLFADATSAAAAAALLGVVGDTWTTELCW